MCHEKPTDFFDGSMARYGQVRSPFDVQFNEDFENENRKLVICIDGETYVLKNAKKITFSIDKECPKVKVLRRMDQPNVNE